MRDPKLSFGYSKQYKVVRLSEIATPNARIGWQNLRRSEFMDSGDVYIITGTDFENGIVNFKGCKFVAPERYEMDDKIKVHEGDILITKDGTIGKVAIVKGLDRKATLNAGVFVLNDINQEVCHEYLYHYLRSPKLLKFINTSSTGGTILHLNQSVLLNFPVTLPSLGEQQKIAAFFTALDEKIACEAKRVEKIKLVKKSCLQKIFGEEMHFNDSTPWVETSFGEVSTFVNGRAYAQNELLSRGKYLVLRVGNFFTNSEYYYSDLELDEDKYANDGDLLYAWSASFGPRIWNGGKVIYHYHIWKVVPKNVDKNFLFYALQYDVDGIKGQLNGGTMSHLTKSGIEERVIKIPCDNEQKEIGEFLKLLDQKIVIASRKLEVLVRQKKSFIQRMFI